jgi:hypothetical protein
MQGVEEREAVIQGIEVVGIEQIQGGSLEGVTFPRDLPRDEVRVSDLGMAPRLWK